jgi:hypothetical protein
MPERARAYLIEISTLSRIIVHSAGLPPGWTETNLTPEIEQRALTKAEHHRVIHLCPNTFETIASYKLQ